MPRLAFGILAFTRVNSSFASNSGDSTAASVRTMDSMSKRMPACDHTMFTFPKTRRTSASVIVVCIAGVAFDCTRCTRTGTVSTGSFVSSFASFVGGSQKPRDADAMKIRTAQSARRMAGGIGGIIRRV